MMQVDSLVVTQRMQTSKANRSAQGLKWSLRGITALVVQAVAASLWIASVSAQSSEPTLNREESEILFVRRIAPLLEAKCLACHGGDRKNIQGGLNLSNHSQLLKGGDSGEPAVVSGKPETSPLYLAVTRVHESWSAMPPKEADRLSEQELRWLRQWIAAGAIWPEESRIRAITQTNAAAWSAEDGVQVRTSGGESEAWTNRRYKPEGLWAYQPVRKPTTPTGMLHPIDAFIAARLPTGLTTAPPTDARTFIRRATLDLTGLPPSPEEVDDFLEDCGSIPLDSPRAEIAIQSLIDRLLASPRYGERMAQHWLDVTRYADSAGFANDYERGNAWRYRDYVVRAFNADKPYDQFVREQIAGDELNPDDPEMLIAVGFLRMGPWELTGMEVAKIARQRFLDDVTNSVGEVFLAHSLQCARCHDHKFDPIPTQDYYSVQAVFATTQLAERPARFFANENTTGFGERQYLEARRDELTALMKSLDDKSLAAVPGWYAERKLDPEKWNRALESVTNARRGRFNAARGVLLKQGVPEDQFPPRMLGLSPEDIGLERIANKGLERLKWEFDRYEPIALSVYNGRTPQVNSVTEPVRVPTNRWTTGELEQTCVLTGGDPFASGRSVQPGVLSVVSALIPQPLPSAHEGRRKAFANWVTSPQNPLAVRTIVNRVWLWHFGQPLAGNPNNLGSTGKRSTHPELLDWLAATLVEQGWSLKSLHRMVMTSQAYRRSTDHDPRPSLAQLDPTGTSYAVFMPRRLSAEELRDAMLFASGELNRAMGGIPNRPEIHLEVALQPRQVMGTFAAAWAPNPWPSQRHRRSLYALRLRGLVDPLLEVFNSPAPDFSCERRDASTITPQAFALWNGPATHARALALAHRVSHEAHNDAEAIQRVYSLLFGRQPSNTELERCLSHWREIVPLVADAPARQSLPLEVRRDALEENTGERFSFLEQLYAHRDFVPDLQPADVDARTRALADLCLVLMNSNEFVYVY
jgi:mono/diheme cytochrome c family protein